MKQIHLPPPIGNIEYVYSDKQIIIVEKPANMLSVPGNTPEKQDCLIHRVQKHFAKARIVHRLDFSTSGLMVVAQNAGSHRTLSIQFQNRETEKGYIAKVYGHPAQASGEVSLPLRCDWERRPRQIVDSKQGKEARTLWKVLDRYEECCRVALTPITGRTHQLRVHMQALGHPILGDDLYAHQNAFKMADRLTLHATKLVITHPTERQRLAFVSVVDPF
ncbi:MAG: RNA pseudouridine synthase [Candidatus Scalindua sp. AMX11]|nr:MAG: RNA pseudouridine synthase [Candidatus Scalindua sp.]NOG85328.1 RNA pseudouridine synthase [Planctomycetota bacterium]RZV81457.1 MAG: RNA pseudouridine synthase [Candidatus Scalindua sp. SCAELEC01]TDE65495.1 MAG: RNA pseudouridine synthase [Candidatus Scalindua sp. AMX11]